MNQTGVVIKPKIGLSYDTGVAKALSRHRGKFAADTPDRPDAATAVLELDYSIIEAIVYYPKRANIRRDTPCPHAPAEQSGRCHRK